MQNQIEEGYVIKLKHSISGETRYIGAIAVADDGTDFENTPFDSFEETTKFPYPTAEVAASVMFSFPKTENVGFEAVEIGRTALPVEAA